MRLLWPRVAGLGFRVWAFRVESLRLKLPYPIAKSSLEFEVHSQLPVYKP